MAKKTLKQWQLDNMKVACIPLYAKDGKYVMFFDKQYTTEAITSWINTETLTVLTLKEIENLELNQVQDDYQNKIYDEKNKNKILEERLDEHDEWVERNGDYSQKQLTMMRVAEKCNTWVSFRYRKRTTAR